MYVSTERIENSQIVLEVEADPDELERSMEGAYHSLVNRAEVPGYRRGKAPREMLERHIGRTRGSRLLLDLKSRLRKLTP